MAWPDTYEAVEDWAPGLNRDDDPIVVTAEDMNYLRELLVGRPWVNIKKAGAKASASAAVNRAAIQAVIDDGLNPYIPRLAAGESYATDGELAVAAAEQVIFGGGRRSHIKQMETGQNVFAVPAALTDVHFQDLHLECADTSSPYTSGAGILFRAGADRGKVNHCLVRGHRGPGVMFQDASHGVCFDSWFLDSLIEDGDHHIDASFDIYVTGSSSYNTILGNYCLSGQGVGIGIQTLAASDAMVGNRALFNVVRNARGYGIMAYRNVGVLPINQTLYHTLIHGNVVDTVTGTMLSNLADVIADVYGTGIYAQGTEFIRITKNDVANTHSANSATVTDQLAPGAIGVVNCSAFDIDDNTVRNAGKDGVHVSVGADLHDIDGISGVRRNKVCDFGRDGFRTIGRSNVHHEDNEAVNLTKTTGGFGYRFLNAGGSTIYRTGVTYRRNTARRTINSGFQFDYLDRAALEDNEAYQSAVHGLALFHVKNSDIINNRGENNKARNFTSTADAANNYYERNDSIGTSTGRAFPDGTAAAATPVAWRFDGTGERVGYNTSDGVGSKTITSPTAAANDATPSVRRLSLLVTANSSATTITALDDIEEGQTVTIVVNDANTTFDFSASSLKGNNGVDYAAASGDAVVATKRNGVVFCAIVQA